MEKQLSPIEHSRNVPPLRFPEFGDEWKKRKLGQLGDFKGGGTPSTTNENYWKGNLPWISSSDISEKDIFNINITRHISNEAAEDSATKIIPKDSVLFVSRVGVGKLAVSKIKLCTSQDFANLIPKKDNSYFIAYYFLSKNKLLHQYAQGTSIKGFTTGDLKSIPIYKPQLPEQQKIASFLTDVDEAITQLTKKKSLLEQYKKGVMQKVFNQELRFKDDEGNSFPEWEEKKLGEVAEINKGKQLNAEFLTKEGSYPCISGGINPSGYTEDFNKIENTITISEGGNSCGYVNFFKTKFWCGGHSYAIENLKNNVVNDFLFQLLKQNEIKIMRLRVGSGLPNIQKKDINNFKFKLPVSISEQTKIANFLSDIDVKIEALTTKIENSNTFKKGLLQQMFV